MLSDFFFTVTSLGKEKENGREGERQREREKDVLSCCLQDIRVGFYFFRFTSSTETEKYFIKKNPFKSNKFIMVFR